MPGHSDRKNFRRQRGRNDSQAKFGKKVPPQDAQPGATVPKAIDTETQRRPAVGVVIYDLETAHDYEFGTYYEKNIFECSQEEQVNWKRQSQIIQFGAVDLHSGQRLDVRCRPEFSWGDIKSHAAQEFAKDHGHDKIIQDESLPHFSHRWVNEVIPFLTRAAGASKRLALIAHNGENFDHFVLKKEIDRLQLPLDLNLSYFDPIVTLKKQYGKDYGSGGQLSLKELYAKYAAQPHKVGAHQAVDDCLMLLEVLRQWEDLAGFLASEIAEWIQVPSAKESVRMRFMCPADQVARGTPPPPPPLPPHPHQQCPVVVSQQSLRQLPPPPSTPAPQVFADQELQSNHELRPGATVFVPGVPWSGHARGADGDEQCTGESGRQVTVAGPNWEPSVPPELEQIGRNRRYQ